MRILLDASGLLGHRLGQALAGQHELTVLDGDPRDRETAARLTARVDAVVCAIPVLASPAADPRSALDRAARGIFNLVTRGAAAGVRRVVLLSSLRPFERYPLDYAVTEYWQPRPTTQPEDLIPFVAEAVVREASHALPLTAICLRMATVVDAQGASDSRAVHVQDAIQAVERALAFEPPDTHRAGGWYPFHIVGAGPRTRFPLGMAGSGGVTPIDMPTLGYVPRYDVSGNAMPTPMPAEPPRRFTAQVGGRARRVVLFGAGGPLAAISAQALERDHVLRLCDKRPLADIVREGRPQSRGAPIPRLLESPHEVRQVDVTEYDQVLEATSGMDAVINMTVMRQDPVEAFRVNTLGAYNVIRAAVECGIRRIVQTGPQQVTNPMPGGYWAEFNLSASVPPRPGVELYFISKFLGQEIMRIFAQEHDLEVPTLVFGPFTNPNDCQPDQLGGYPFLVSWVDAAEAVRGALRAPSFPQPFEVLHVLADLPHGKYQTDRTKRVLHWQPRDTLDIHWRRHR